MSTLVVTKIEKSLLRFVAQNTQAQQQRLRKWDSCFHKMFCIAIIKYSAAVETQEAATVLILGGSDFRKLISGSNTP